MPRKNETKTPAKAIEKFIKRHLEGGESVVGLIKEYKVSRATAYNWIGRYRERAIEESKRQGKSPAAIEKVDKMALHAENVELRKEVRLLKEKLLNLMIKTKQI